MLESSVRILIPSVGLARFWATLLSRLCTTLFEDYGFRLDSGNPRPDFSFAIPVRMPPLMLGLNHGWIIPLNPETRSIGRMSDCQKHNVTLSWVPKGHSSNIWTSNNIPQDLDDPRIAILHLNVFQHSGQCRTVGRDGLNPQICKGIRKSQISTSQW